MIEVPLGISWLREPGPEGDVVVSSRGRLSRNLSSRRFVRSLDDAGLLDLTTTVRPVLESLEGSWSVSAMFEMGAPSRKLLLEQNVVSADFIMGENGVLAVDESFRANVMVGYVDHLRMGCFAPGLAVGDVCSQLYGIDAQLEESLDFAADTTLGYLGPNPSNLGTALRLSVLVHLPGLAEAGLLDKGFRAVLQAGGEIRGFMAEDEGSLGDLYQVSNRETLGWSEDELVENLENMARQLVHYERMAREEVRARNTARIEDRIGRSRGILGFCRYLEMREAVEHLANLRWGLSYGLHPHDLGVVTELMFLVQDAHVRAINGESGGDPRPIEECRADMVRNSMNGVT